MKPSSFSKSAYSTVKSYARSANGDEDLDLFQKSRNINSFKMKGMGSLT